MIRLSVRLQDSSGSAAGPARGHELPLGDTLWLGREAAAPSAERPTPVLELGAHPSQALSRTAVGFSRTRQGLVRVRCEQTPGHVEVTRPDGTRAAALRRDESAALYPPFAVTVHTARGPRAFIQVGASAPDAPTSPPRPGFDPNRTTVAWTYALVTAPPGDLDWIVPAAIAAALFHRHQEAQTGREVGSTELMRACSDWAGVKATNGWLYGKFAQARRSLGAALAGNPAHQLGEYVVTAGLLSADDIRAVAVELDRRRHA